MDDLISGWVKGEYFDVIVFETAGRQRRRDALARECIPARPSRWAPPPMPQDATIVDREDLAVVRASAGSGQIDKAAGSAEIVRSIPFIGPFVVGPP
jgi:nitroimidazol reductase NimA-like FMN-containing flavoprotein (pyridoxamine 5'-phosphate oxidase superfamily)